MPRSDCDVLVVGAGVSGLTTAACLAEAGLRVTLSWGCARDAAALVTRAL